ncbi:MAG: response regulator, partial [Nitrosopumilus sp.]|nr:response regulator [Nitrosopumilus sp.]
LLIEDAFAESGTPGKIQFVQDGEELMQYLRREADWTSLNGQPLPALVLLDLNMPRLDGRQALKQIKGDENLCVIPIVVLTTSIAEEDVQSSYRAGVNSYLSKPRTFEDLMEIVRTLDRYWMSTVRLPENLLYSLYFQENFQLLDLKHKQSIRNTSFHLLNNLQPFQYIALTPSDTLHLVPMMEYILNCHDNLLQKNLK